MISPLKDNLLNFKISIGIFVLLGILFFRILIDNFYLASAIYWGFIWFLILGINSFIGILVNIFKRKTRKHPYILVIFHAIIFVVSVVVIVVKCIVFPVILEIFSEVGNVIVTGIGEALLE